MVSALQAFLWREMGMVHVVRARKQGFAHRYPFDRFVSRYGYLLKGREVTDAAFAPLSPQHRKKNC